MILFSDYLCNLTFQKLFFLLLRNPFLLHGSLNEGSISPINEDSEDNFNSKIKQIIQRSLFLTIKQKQLQPAKLANLLPGTNLILGKYYDSKKCSISKNNKQELEFYNNTQSDYYGLSYCDFILDRSTNYVVHVELQ